MIYPIRKYLHESDNDQSKKPISIWYWCILIYSLIALSGCHTENEFVAEYDIADSTQIHVSGFFRIAKEKGFDIDTSNLIVRFENELTTGSGSPVCGNAKGPLNGENQHVIRIDPECLAWRHSEESREILIFHEMGHIFLERVHFNELFDNGDYKSLMFGDQWNIFRFYTEDPAKRSYYINELFDPATPAPDWSD